MKYHAVMNLFMKYMYIHDITLKYERQSYVYIMIATISYTHPWGLTQKIKCKRNYFVKSVGYWEFHLQYPQIETFFKCVYVNFFFPSNILVEIYNQAQSTCTESQNFILERNLSDQIPFISYRWVNWGLVVIRGGVRAGHWRSSVHAAALLPCLRKTAKRESPPGAEKPVCLALEAACSKWSRCWEWLTAMHSSLNGS